MALTFPIDTKDPGEIPAFQPILEEFPGSEGVLRYLCWRFDPKSSDVRMVQNISEKQRLAEKKSGFKCPIPDVAFVDENGVAHMSDEWKDFAAISLRFFPLLNNPDWELMVSIEIAMDEGNGILREPIPANADIDTKAKSQLLKINTAKGCEDMRKIRNALISDLANGDEAAERLIRDNTSERKRRDAAGRLMP